MSKNTVKVPDSLFVGLVPRHRNESLPVGYVTAYGTDKSSINRMENVKRSCNYKGDAPRLGTTVVENKPLYGFKLVSHAIGTSQDYWMVEDPRGFTTEISGSNLFRLIASSIISNGELLSPCVWGREGGNNILINTDSDEYAVAIENTAASKGKASWKDVKIGDTVLLRNNLKGRWLGKMYLVLNNSRNSLRGPIGENEYNVTDKVYHLILETKERDKRYSSTLHMISAPQLSKVISTNEISKAESEILVSECLNDLTCYKQNNFYSRVLAATFNQLKKDDFTLITEQVCFETEDELMEQIVTSYVDLKPAVFIKTSTTFGRVFHNRYGHDPFKVSEYCTAYFQDNQLRKLLKERQHSYSGTRGYAEKDYKYAFRSSDTFYNIKLCIKTSANSFESYI